MSAILQFVTLVHPVFVSAVVLALSCLCVSAGVGRVGGGQDWPTDARGDRSSE